MPSNPTNMLLSSLVSIVAVMVFELETPDAELVTPMALTPVKLAAPTKV